MAAADRDAMTQDELKSRIHYDPATGVFRWLTTHRNIKAGDIAGWHSGKNMWRINFGSKLYLAHRLAWFYTHGEWPQQIDHINGDRRDNRIANLRPADNSQNQANMGAKSNNRLGMRGISVERGRYKVQLRKGNIKVSRYFGSLEEAKTFAIATSKELHGEFSVHNR